MSKFNDSVKKIPEWVKGGITFITTVISFIIFLQSNFHLLIVVLGITFIVGGIAYLSNIVFSKTKPKIEGEKGVYRYKKYRGLAIIGIFVMFFG